MIDIKAAASNCDYSPYHSLLSSFFAGLAELGMINQGSINIAAKRAAQHLYSYLDARENLPDMRTIPGDTTAEVVKNLILYINKILYLMDGFDLQEADAGRVVLLVEGDNCWIYPTGVWGTEDKCTLCPISSFLESLVNQVADQKILDTVTTSIDKQGTICKVYYKIVSEVH